MNAEITVKIKINNICDSEDLKDTRMTFKEMVEWLIKEEGIYEVMTWGEEPNVINIKELK